MPARTLRRRAAPPPAYDPAYDPLVSPPGQGQDYAPTYWVATAVAAAGRRPGQWRYGGDAVVGSGFTGLSAALTLARDYGVRAVVLEANRAVWGCTSRNGGQGQNASGRLYRSQWIQRWGLDTARRLDAEIREGFEYWKSLVAQVDCDAQPRPSVHGASAEEDGLPGEREPRHARGLRLRHAHAEQGPAARALRGRPRGRGALLEPDGVGVHPLKLAYGYLRQARALGASIHPSSPVLGWRAQNGAYLLQTPGGTVRARRVAFATGGYTAQGVNPLLDNRIMPVLSNSLVTRALSPAELEAAGLKAPSSSPTRARCALLPVAAGRPRADRQPQRGSMAPTRRTRATWPCSRPGWRVVLSCATWTWIIPGGAGWTSATT